jgi:poly(A) polymerase
MIQSTEVNVLLQRVHAFCSAAGLSAYLVGGFVRDCLNGRSSPDIDLVLSADALEQGRRLAEYLEARYVPLDEANSICRVVVKTGSDQAGEAAVYLDLASLRGDIRSDLALRDFTIDAIAVSLTDYLHNGVAAVIDPFNGRQDLQNGLIRALGPAVFKADYARLLRAFRLAAELRCEIESATLDYIRENRTGISGVAGERIHDELVRLFSGRAAGKMVRRLDEAGLLTLIIPELEAGRGVTQPPEHHWDVLEHSLESVVTAGRVLRRGDCDYIPDSVLTEIPWSPELAANFNSPVGSQSDHGVLVLLSALLHDIAKPGTRIVENERIRFFGHNEQGAETSAAILARLRFSNREVNMVETMVRYHMRPTQMSNQGLPSARAIYRFFRDCGAAALDTLYLSLADHLAARGPLLDREQWQWHLGQVRHILSGMQQNETLIRPPKLVDGHDLMRLFGLHPGPRIREVLESVREAQAEGELHTREEALSYIENRLLYRKQNS